MSGSRDVTPLIAKIRNLLLQRKLVNHPRFEDKYQPRTQPPPHLPSTRLKYINNSPYCKVDARRKALPATYLYSATAHKLMPSVTGNKTSGMRKLKVPVVPGLGYTKETEQTLFEPSKAT